MTGVHLPGEREDRLAAEGHDHAPWAQTLDRATADPVERRLALEEPDRRGGKRTLDERQRFERPEQKNVPVLRTEQEAGPRGASLLVVCPLHLVEDEHLAVKRRHLGRAADDPGVL